jgi:ATP-dependent DNA helicase MPH1
MVNALFTVLASLAHSVDLLKYHGISPFYRSITSFESSAQAGKGKTAQQIADDKNFKEMMLLLRRWTRIPQFIGHPKLEYLKQVVLNHFLDAGNDTAQGRGHTASDTRIMIFAHFRDSAEDIVRVLKIHEPIIKPHVFVGQANANGSEGMGQKTQLDIVKKFKAGVYNTIVATSIGEEGLDIGEVDLIVCYDSSSSPIRMLQRMGRTGRKRDGNIVLLLMKGKEEESYIRAKDNYEKMQEMIACGDRFNYHTDTSPRIIPRDIQPYPEEKMIDIPIENSQADLPEPKKPKGRLKKRAPKKFHMPDGVETGFTTASRVGCPKPPSSISDLDEVVHGNFSEEGQEEEEIGSLSSSDDLASIPSPNTLSLTLSQRADLAEELQSAPEATFEPPRVDAFPTLQRLSRKTKFVRHGRATRGMVKALGKIAGMGFDCEDECKEHFRPDDAARFRSSSPEEHPKPRSRRRRRRDSEINFDTDVSDPFSSPADFLTRSEVNMEECDESDESDLLPDPSDLFGKLLSTNREAATNPSLDEAAADAAADLDSLDDSTPQPSAPRRNRNVISDDSDSS